MSKTYDDCNSQGEALAVWRGEHICLNCGLSPVCVLGREADGLAQIALPVVSRCALYSPAEPEPE